MKCNPKSMVTLAAALLAVLAVSYFAFPAAQGFIVASAPILLTLICPVMMLTMRGRDGGAAASAPKIDISRTHKTPDAVHEA